MAPYTSSPLRAVSLREQAREEIRTRVVAGDITADQVISVGSIAEELQVSITPVREAVMDLAGVGILEIVRNRGFRAVSITDHDLDEIFTLRTMLELPATVQVAQLQPDPLTLKPYHELAHKIVESARAGEIIRFLDYDRQLHLGLISLLNNKRLVKILGDLRDQTRLTGLSELAEKGTLADTAEEHLELVDLIEAGDAKEVEKLMKGHLAHSRGIWAGKEE